MKKVLSWVLVLALVLSSFTMAFAADKTANSSDMKDAAAIANVEAVDVMVATGIIGGYPDGYYYPEKAVTRAEMAKMISVAVNGGEDVGAYYADGCTFADSVNHWAAGYIAYCANEGIIDGRDANTFDPDATVTGLEAAKMMLVALGYDSKIEKYVGDQWANNVLKAAKANKLFDGCDDFTAGAALDRDNAAQIIFNGLKAPTVAYDYDWEITAGDTTITVETAANKVVDDTPNLGDFAQLFEVAFTDSVLAYKTDDGYEDDAFERPAHGWSLDGKEIGVYADAADYTFVVDEAQTLAEALKDFDDETFGTISTDYTIAALYENGQNNATVDGTTAVAVGSTVELYEGAADAYTVVVVTYEAVEITEVDTNVTTSDAKNDVTAYVYLDGSKYFDTAVVGYDAATYVEDAVLAVAFNGTTVLDSYVIEKVTGKVEYEHASAFTMDGTKYTLAGNYTKLDGETVKAGDSTYDFYLINGYLAGSVLVSEVSETFYGVALNDDTRAVEFGAADTILKVVNSEADEVVYTIDAAASVTIPGSLDGTAPNAKIMAYQINEDGEIDAIQSVTAGDLGLSYVDASGEDNTLTSRGVFDGHYVADDVVIFFNDGTDAEPEYVVYGYDDLANAEDVSAIYFANEDGEIVAMYVTDGFESATTDAIGFFVELVDSWTDADTTKYATFTLLVDGQKVDYTGEVEAGELSVLQGFSGNEVVKVTVKADGSIDAVEAADADTPIVDGQLVTSFSANKEYATYTANSTKAGSGEAITTAHGVQVVDYVYMIVDGEMTVVKASKVPSGKSVTFYQFADDAEVWNVAVFTE